MVCRKPQRRLPQKPFQNSTTVHKDVTDRLTHINPTLASRARVVLDVNKSERHIRGGMATREKYQHRLAICSKEDKS
ncbi:MAG: sporulation transcriptional regulator SpoIIID [Lachnospiraceae bacterium]